MSIPAAVLGLPTGIPGWALLQKRPVADFKGFVNDPSLKSDTAYLRAKLAGKTTAKALLADPRLQQIVLTAYGLESQIGMNGLMEKVLTSDLANPKSLANKLTNPLFRTIAKDFNFGGVVTPAVPVIASRTVLQVNGLGPGSSFGSFSGTLGGVKIRGLDMSGATDATQLAARLQAAFRKADGNRTDLSVTVDAGRLVFADAKGRGDLREMTLDPVIGARAVFVANGLPSADAPIPPSRAEIAVTGLSRTQTIGNFSGTFAGVTLNDVDLSAATTQQEIAATLQVAFRAADGKAADIGVMVIGDRIRMTDAKGRGGASDVSFATTPGGATARLAATTVDASGVMQAPVMPAPSTAKVQLSNFGARSTFTTFTGTFGGVTLTGLDISAATDRQGLAAALQEAFRAADSGRADITVAAVGDSLVFTDAQGKGGASKVSFAAKSLAKATVTATSGPPSFTAPRTTSTLAVSGFDATHTLGRIGGTFAGITVAPIDTSALTTLGDLAATLESAFRAADGNRAFISVTAKDSTLVFTDISGRAGATAFDIADAGGAGPTAGVVSTEAGRQAVAASGGPAVTSAAFLDRLVQKYTDAQFAKTVGGVSPSLRLALYARQALPKITNWYSVIADTKLAKVVETALGLPAESFGAVPVDQQAAILKGRMDIRDLKDPEKLAKLLDRFVAISSVSDITAGGDATAGIAGLLMPLGSGEAQDGGGADVMLGATSAAIFSVLYGGTAEEGAGGTSGAGLALQLLSSASAAYG